MGHFHTCVDFMDVTMGDIPSKDCERRPSTKPGQGFLGPHHSLWSPPTPHQPDLFVWSLPPLIPCSYTTPPPPPHWENYQEPQVAPLWPKKVYLNIFGDLFSCRPRRVTDLRVCCLWAGPSVASSGAQTNTCEGSLFILRTPEHRHWPDGLPPLTRRLRSSHTGTPTSSPCILPLLPRGGLWSDFFWLTSWPCVSLRYFPGLCNSPHTPADPVKNRSLYTVFNFLLGLHSG